MRPWLKILLLGLVATAHGDPEKKPDTSELQTPKYDPVIPVGQRVKGMHLPYYSLDGMLKMQFDAAGAVRSDQENIEMEKLRIETFDVRGKSEMIVSFPTAKFNLITNIITSPDEASIKRADFQITGKGVEFDTKAKRGRLFSQIRMEIYSRQTINPQTENGQ